VCIPPPHAHTPPQAYPSTYLSSAIMPIAVAVATGFVVAQVRRHSQLDRIHKPLNP